VKSFFTGAPARVFTRVLPTPAHRVRVIFRKGDIGV
jgi:hypothetical protein